MTEQKPHWLEEPPIDPLADTNPSLTVRPVDLDSEPTTAVPGWRRTAGLVSLLAAAALTVATAVVLLIPTSTTPTPEVIAQPATATVPPTPIPEQPTTVAVVPENTTTGEVLPPTISPEQASALLSQPLQSLDVAAPFQIVRDVYNPFTTVPDRPRNEVIQYEAVKGDSIYSIAERFGLQPETIAWSNPRSIIEILSPGQEINILPVDGVYEQAIGSTTVRELAAKYKVTDPYTILDSEFNSVVLVGDDLDTILPSGTWVVIPGGQAEDITWNPGIVTDGGSSGSGGNGYVTQFAPGQPGSCGAVQNPGGGAYWGKPLSSYTWVRGFSSWHTGVDLAAPTGTPVYAANSGVVIFNGWNSWGYGTTVVLAHGPYLTLYGHMSGTTVGCGQYVTVGQQIGMVGSTGNSSGPHLHFEIRYGQTPQDPSATIGF
ncbi:MAG: peptidoglycan DD-metalloendopeptidase family protein [Anaerolineaceae bacterium]|nr:peptidoglycan DD-metalloendopeptidase family protein [Anaerolineaceae bacterium]